MQIDIRFIRALLTSFLSFFLIGSLHAGSKDTLTLQLQNNKPFFWHVVKEGEGSLAIARRYAIYTDDLVKWNHLDLSMGLEIGDSLRIPVTPTNLKKNSKAPAARAIYHRVGWGENLTTLAGYMGTTREELIKRNDTLLKNGLKAGQFILMGWVTDRWDTNGKFIPGIKNTPAPGSGKKLSTAVDAKADSILNAQWIREQKAGTTVKKSSLSKRDSVDVSDKEQPAAAATAPNNNGSGFQSLYATQTAENKTVSENGLCVFYPVGGKLYFAFHNKAKTGTIIEVKNPGTGKVIYAKVLGTIPANGVYHNARIVLSSNARKALGVTDQTFFSNLKYALFAD